MLLLLSKAKMQTSGALCGESAAVEIGEASLQATFLGDFVDLPMPTFVWTDAVEEAGGLQVGEMFLYGFRGYSYSFGQ